MYYSLITELVFVSRKSAGTPIYNRKFVCPSVSQFPSGPLLKIRDHIHGIIRRAIYVHHYFVHRQPCIIHAQSDQFLLTSAPRIILVKCFVKNEIDRVCSTCETEEMCIQSFPEEYERKKPLRKPRCI